MSKNRGVVYTKPGEVQVQDIADPKFEDPRGRKIEHGVILKVVSTNICGSDQHMVRGRTTAPAGMVLGHEITGEVIEKGSDVEMIALGDLVSVPFNVACGRCRCLPGDEYRRVPDGQSRSRRRRLWLCGHGRLDRRPGPLRHGPLCRFQPAQVPGQEPGPIQDHGPDHADGHPADRLPWRLDCGRQAGLDGLRRRRRSGRPRGGRLRPAPRRGCDHDRRHERGAARATPKTSASCR